MMPATDIFSPGLSPGRDLLNCTTKVWSGSGPTMTNCSCRKICCTVTFDKFTVRVQNDSASVEFKICEIFVIGACSNFNGGPGIAGALAPLIAPPPESAEPPRGGWAEAAELPASSREQDGPKIRIARNRAESSVHLHRVISHDKSNGDRLLLGNVPQFARRKRKRITSFVQKKGTHWHASLLGRRMRRRIGVPPGYYVLLLKVLNQRAVVGNFDGRIFARFLK